MSCVSDWILNPLNTVDKLFEENNNLNYEYVKGCFEKFLEDKNSLARIPSLNDVASHNIKTGSLVHYRCMIQDMFDPEFYLGKYEVHRLKTGQRKMCCGLFRDIITSNPDDEEIDFDGAHNKPLDRQTLYCIPIPGESSWAKEIYSSMISKEVSGSLSAEVSRPKQSRNQDETGCHQAMPVSNVNSEVETMVTDDYSEGEMKDNGSSKETIADDDTSENKTKRFKSQECSNTCSTLPDLNFPLPSEQGVACILKIYDPACDLRLNDMIEVIGVFSADPLMLLSTQSSDGNCAMLMDAEEEHDARNPPPSLVPRLHAVVVNRLSHNNPYLPRDLSACDGDAVDCEAIREHVIAVLEQMLLGDRLAAEYLLCHLISSVYGRQDVVALGKFALNLSNCPADNLFISHVYSIISKFVTKSHLLPMSLSNMNSLKLVPCKDYKLNRLQAGTLQLSARTNLVIDETALQPGQLDATGVNNTAALGTVISWQKIDYDFNYHKQTFPTDIVTLVLSEGKSIFKCDCQVPLLTNRTLHSFDELVKGIQAYLTPALLEQIRTYLGKAQLSTYSISSDMQKVIEEDFVESRRIDANAMTVDDFHTLLTLTRLLSLSHGKKCPSMEVWTEAKLMECSRKQRISS